MGVDLLITNRNGQTINLNDETNWYCLNLSGTGLPTPRTWLQPLPYEHGSLYVGMKYPERQLTAHLVLKGESYADRLRLEGELVDVVGTHRGLLTLTITLASGAQRVINGVVTDGLQYPPEALVGPTARRIPLVFTCPDPLFRATTRTVVTLPNWAQSGGFAYYGTAPAYPRIEITGPVTNPTITNLNTNQKLSFALSLAAGERLEITTTPGHKAAIKVSSTGVETDVTTTLTADSAIWAIERRNNAILVTGTGGSGSAGTLSFVTRYLSLG